MKFLGLRGVKFLGLRGVEFLGLGGVEFLLSEITACEEDEEGGRRIEEGEGPAPSPEGPAPSPPPPREAGHVWAGTSWDRAPPALSAFKAERT